MQFTSNSQRSKHTQDLGKHAAKELTSFAIHAVREYATNRTTFTLEINIQATGKRPLSRH